MEEGIAVTDLNAGSVSECGDGAVVGEALQLALALHGDAPHDVGARLPAAKQVERRRRRRLLVLGSGGGGGHADAFPDGAHPLALRLAQPLLAPPPRRRRALDEAAGTPARPLPGDPPDQSALRRPRAAPAASPVSVPVSASASASAVEEGGVEHGDGVEAREGEELRLAVPAVEVQRGEHHLLAVARLLLPPPRGGGPSGEEDPGRRGGRGLAGPPGYLLVGGVGEFGVHGGRTT